MLGSPSCGNNWQLNVKCAGAQHTFHAVLASDGNIEDDDGGSIHVNDDVGVLIDRTDEGFDRLQDAQVGAVVDLVSTTLIVLLFQFCLPKYSASAFWFLVYDGFVLPIWIASSGCALRAVSARLACGLAAQYSLRLFQMKGLAPSMKMPIRVDSS